MNGSKCDCKGIMELQCCWLLVIVGNIKSSALKEAQNFGCQFASFPLGQQHFSV
jgi:hypothetical protein